MDWRHTHPPSQLSSHPCYSELQALCRACSSVPCGTKPARRMLPPESVHRRKTFLGSTLPISLSDALSLPLSYSLFLFSLCTPPLPRAWPSWTSKLSLALSNSPLLLYFTLFLFLLHRPR